jgi:hypothetical protein
VIILQSRALLRLLVCLGLVLSALAGGLLGPARGRADQVANSPGTIPPPPPTVVLSQSYYIEGAAGSALDAVLMDDGETQAGSDCDGGAPVDSDVILDFGAQQISGTETESVDGVSFYTQSDIENMALSFAEGYAEEGVFCNAEYAEGYPLTFLSIGTSSSGPVPTPSEAVSQADDWASVGYTTAENYTTWADSNLDEGGLSAVWFSPASDIELGFNPEPDVIPWVNEMYADAESELASQGNVLFGDALGAVDYGDVAGCYSSTGSLTGSMTCQGTWTVADANTVISELAPDPEIYIGPETGPGQPMEWTQMCVYNDTNPGDGTSVLSGAAVLSEPTGGSGYLSTADSWSDLITDLEDSGDTDCATQLPANESNVDMAATPNGNIQWPS